MTQFNIKMTTTVEEKLSTVHRVGIYPSFHQSFSQHLASEKPEDEKEITFFINDGKFIESLSFTAKRLLTSGEGQIYELSGITYQSEDDNFHDFCSTDLNRDPSKPYLVTYNHSQDLILEDAFLGDKYETCFDGWFSEFLKCMFERTPSKQ